MRTLWFVVKWVGTVTLIAGLVFASGVFTVLLYGKITGELGRYTGEAEHVNVVYADSRDMIEELEEPEIEEEPDPEPEIKPAAMLSAPMIKQYPELPRGCEITSLTMLLHFYGYDMDKTDLLPEMLWDETPIRWDKNGISYWGHPNTGFVGDITLNSSGFGIYHAALFPLLEQYIPTAIDLTERPFSDLEAQVSQGIPVVVWTTLHYRTPRADQWVEWDTPIGPIRTTHLEHAVLLVGYDEDYVYVNDPYIGKPGDKIDKQQFIKTWELMGKQALSYEEHK